ncbi:MAG: preprotein translocase subunit TatC [Desulfobacteraceae bacterium]|nr:MAG: preprotein translocase subunit TatC [Desulfobacteraceae bacterium]
MIYPVDFIMDFHNNQRPRNAPRDIAQGRVKMMRPEKSSRPVHMVNSFPPPDNRQQFLRYLEHMRRDLIHIGIAIVIAFIGIYPVSLSALRYLKSLIHADLAAFGIPEAFFAILTLDLGIAVFICIPFISCKILAPLPQHFSSFSNRAIFAFWLTSTALFYGGVLFCLTVTLPFGIQFLLSFEASYVKPLISVSKYISFCFLFLFGFGLIFQMPVVMVLLGRLFSIDAKQLAKHRRQAVLILTIVAAVLTPTPDALNMMLMAVPLYLLFEIGLLGMRFFR